MVRLENLFLSHLTKRWAVYKGVRLGRYYSVSWSTISLKPLEVNYKIAIGMVKILVTEWHLGTELFTMVVTIRIQNNWKFAIYISWLIECLLFRSPLCALITSQIIDFRPLLFNFFFLRLQPFLVPNELFLQKQVVLDAIHLEQSQPAFGVRGHLR